MDELVSGGGPGLLKTNKRFKLLWDFLILTFTSVFNMHHQAVRMLNSLPSLPPFTRVARCFAFFTVKFYHVYLMSMSTICLLSSLWDGGKRNFDCFLCLDRVKKLTVKLTLTFYWCGGNDSAGFRNSREFLTQYLFSKVGNLQRPSFNESTQSYSIEDVYPMIAFGFSRKHTHWFMTYFANKHIQWQIRDRLPHAAENWFWQETKSFILGFTCLKW